MSLAASYQKMGQPRVTTSTETTKGGGGIGGALEGLAGGLQPFIAYYMMQEMAKQMATQRSTMLEDLAKLFGLGGQGQQMTPATIEALMRSMAMTGLRSGTGSLPFGL